MLATPSPLSTSSLTLSPNPAHSLVRLSNLSQPSRCTLYNLLGQLVLMQALPVSATEAALPLSGLAPGLYTLQVQTATGVRSEKLLLE
jgi:hypothetical protein